MSNWITIVISLIFCLSPAALTIHLAAKRNMPKANKIKLVYAYGGLWAIAIAYYLVIYLH